LVPTGNSVSKETQIDLLRKSKMSNNSLGTDSSTTSVNYTLNESTQLSDDLGGTVSSLTTSVLSTTADDSKITAHMIEKKQLLHEMDRLRIELSHKTLLVESYKAELMNKIDDLEEKLSDITYSKHMLKAKLESQLKLKEDEANIQQRHLKEQLAEITNRQKQLEEENIKLHEKAGYLKSNLFVDIDCITEEQYVDLKSSNADQLSLKDYITVSNLLLFGQIS
jgi:progesterone-induced-blocking factor 1